MSAWYPAGTRKTIREPRRSIKQQTGPASPYRVQVENRHAGRVPRGGVREIACFGGSTAASCHARALVVDSISRSDGRDGARSLIPPRVAGGMASVSGVPHEHAVLRGSAIAAPVEPDGGRATVHAAADRGDHDGDAAKRRTCVLAARDPSLGGCVMQSTYNSMLAQQAIERRCARGRGRPGRDPAAAGRHPGAHVERPAVRLGLDRVDPGRAGGARQGRSAARPVRGTRATRSTSRATPTTCRSAPI